MRKLFCSALVGAMVCAFEAQAGSIGAYTDTLGGLGKWSLGLEYQVPVNSPCP